MLNLNATEFLTTPFFKQLVLMINGQVGGHQSIMLTLNSFSQSICFIQRVQAGNLVFMAHTYREACER